MISICCPPPKTDPSPETPISNNWEIPNITPSEAISDPEAIVNPGQKTPNSPPKSAKIDQKKSERKWEETSLGEVVGENPCDQHIEESGFQKGREVVGGSPMSDFNLEMDLLREGVDLNGDREPCLSNVSVVD